MGEGVSNQIQQDENILINFVMFPHNLQQHSLNWNNAWQPAMLLWRWTHGTVLPLKGHPVARCKRLIELWWVVTKVDPEWCQYLHISTHRSRITPDLPWPLHLASGLRQICREFLWTPLLLFLIVLNDTLLIFSPLLFSQERDCSSSPVVFYRKREDSWWGRCLGNCMNQSWPYLISGFRSGGQVCFLTVFFPLFPLFLCSCYLKVS